MAQRFGQTVTWFATPFSITSPQAAVRLTADQHYVGRAMTCQATHAPGRASSPAACVLTQALHWGVNKHSIVTRQGGSVC